MLKAEGADVVAIAKASGFSITTEDLKPLQPVSEAELEGMAGGDHVKKTLILVAGGGL